MRQSPCEVQKRCKEDCNADRLVELVELELPRWFEPGRVIARPVTTSEASANAIVQLSTIATDV